MSESHPRLSIGLDIRTLAPRTPGQQRYLHRLGAWLAERGHEVVLTTARHTAEQVVDVPTPPGVRFEVLPGRDPRAVARRLEALGLDVLLANPERARHLRRVRPNLLRSAYGTEQYRQKLRSFRAPVGRALRQLWRRNPWLRRQQRWERAFYEDRDPAPLVIAQSEYMRGQILESYAISGDRVRVVVNAVDPGEFSPDLRAERRGRASGGEAGLRGRLGLADDTTCLLFVGHNYRLKGLWQVLEHVANVRSRGHDVHLLVAGRGTGRRQRAEAERRIARLGLVAHVSRLGPVEHPAELYDAADVLIHLTWHDSFGFVVLEAMACGLAVITTPWAGAHELVQPGRTGFVVDPADGPAVDEAIEQLCDPTQAHAFGLASATIAREHAEPRNFERVEALMLEASTLPIVYHT